MNSTEQTVLEKAQSVSSKISFSCVVDYGVNESRSPDQSFSSKYPKCDFFSVCFQTPPTYEGGPRIGGFCPVSPEFPALSKRSLLCGQKPPIRGPPSYKQARQLWSLFSNFCQQHSWGENSGNDREITQPIVPCCRRLTHAEIGQHDDGSLVNVKRSCAAVTDITRGQQSERGQ